MAQEWSLHVTERAAPSVDPVADRLPPRPPRSGLRRLSWREAQFLVLEAGGAGPGSSARVSSMGLVPVIGGRVVVRGGLRVPLDGGDWAPEAGRGEEAALRSALEDRFIVSWSPLTAAAALNHVLGGELSRWRDRAIDLRGLAAVVARLSGRGGAAPDPETATDLEAAASRYRVPLGQPSDDLDRALAAAQLFLVLATKLESHGRGDVRSLLRGRLAVR